MGFFLQHSTSIDLNVKNRNEFTGFRGANVFTEVNFSTLFTRVENKSNLKLLRRGCLFHGPEN